VSTVVFRHIANFTYKKQQATIRDFGNQWMIHGELRADYWTSDEMFRDYLGNIFEPKLMQGKKVLEVGSGSGRILRMINRYSPAELIGVEPSKGFETLRSNTKDLKNLVLENLKGSNYVSRDLDFVFSLGVIHHIKNPKETLSNIYSSLNSDGKFIIWVYGLENNRIYVIFRFFVSFFCRALSDVQLDKVSQWLQKVVVKYGEISFKFANSSLPLTKYILEVFTPCGEKERKYIVFDQLNPAYAKYYSRRQLVKILSQAGFSKIFTEHRHKYSWVAVAHK
jgi:SAM-dependent methyltransferase